MTPDEVEGMLDGLGRGDSAATAALCEAYSAYLRAVVRRQLSPRLRSQFDSADVVQSVWIQVLRRIEDRGLRVESEGQLRALLGLVARRRLCTRARSPAAAERFAAAGVEVDCLPAGQPPASEVARAGELWDELLRLCPPAHREVLRLRRDGLTPAEIAVRTGLHDGSVRRVLRRLARDLAVRSADGPAAEGVP